MRAADRALRRLLRKPAVANLLAEQVSRLGAGHAIADPTGRILLGEVAHAEDQPRPLAHDGALIGHTYGAQREGLAAIIEAFAAMEAEARALANESLGRYRELTMLYEVSERIIGALDPGSVAVAVSEEARRFLKCDSVSVLLHNEETGMLEVAATNGAPFHSRASLEVGSDVVGSVIETGNGEIVNDVGDDARSLRADNALRSIVCSPLRSKERVIGVLVAGTESARHFNAGDLQLLNAMGAQAATAIEVARLDRELHTASRKPADLIYGVGDRPPLGASILLGLQHVFIALISLAYPVLITLEAGGSRGAAASVVSMSLLAMALATAVQVFRVGPVGAGYLAPYITSAIYVGPSLFAARLGGLSLVFGMTLVAGLVALALSQLLRRFRRLFPPEVSGVVVLMVGLSIVPLGVSRLIGLGVGDSVVEPEEWTVGLLTLGCIVALTVAPFGRLRLYATAIGIGLGYAAGLALGLFGEGAFAALGNLPLLGTPPLPAALPTFDALLVVPFLAVALASCVKDAGLVIGCQKASDASWKRPDTRSVSGGVVVGGLGNLASGLLGGAGVGISAGSVGLSIATGATARSLGFLVAAMFAALAFMPKVTAAIAIMPSPVMGAGLVFVACHLITSGTELIASRMLDARRTYVIGLALVAGIGTLALPGISSRAPEWIEVVLGNPLTVSTLVVFVLNLVLSAGIARTAEARVAIDERLHDSMSRFFERQGAAWAARVDVVRRAVPAVTEYCEELQAAVASPAAVLALEFDEFRLVATVSATAEEPLSTASAHAARAELERAAKRISRRYGCTVQVLGTATARFDFEH